MRAQWGITCVFPSANFFRPFGETVSCLHSHESSSIDVQIKVYDGATDIGDDELIFKTLVSQCDLITPDEMCGKWRDAKVASNYMFSISLLRSLFISMGDIT